MDPTEQSDLWQRVYELLRRQARALLVRERRNHTLQPTALVHEVFLRLRKHRAASKFDDLEIYRAATSAMRRVLVDHARRRKRLKRSSSRGTASLAFDQELESLPLDPVLLLDLDAASKALAGVNRRSAEIVHMRFFGGLTETEVASLLGCSRRTVQAEFKTARAWLGTYLAAHRQTSA